MELPHLGEHCSDPLCKQLDFLPVRCDACQKTFCKDHYLYSSHNCPEAYKKDNQVPVCPLCNRPIPLGATGESPDVVVGRHIDNDCQSETAQTRRKVYSNRCSLKGCKQKEVVPLMCERCRKNYCLRHRHEMDHECRGFENTGRAVSSQGAAALARSKDGHATDRRPQQTPMTFAGKELDRERQQRQQTQSARLTAVTAHSLQQPGLSEDEALRRALELSLGDTSQSTSSDAERRRQEEMDEVLARALQESERDAIASTARRPVNPTTTQQHANNDKSNCSMS